MEVNLGDEMEKLGSIAVFGEGSDGVSKTLSEHGLSCSVIDVDSEWRGQLPTLVVATELPTKGSFPLPPRVPIALVSRDLSFEPFGADGLRVGAGDRNFVSPKFALACSATFHDTRRWGALSASIPHYGEKPLRPKDVEKPYAFVDFPRSARSSAEERRDDATLVENARIYVDREYYVLRAHEAIEGKNLIQTPNEAKNDRSFSMTVSVPEKSCVYVAVDEESEIPGWVFEDWRRLEWCVEIVEHKRRYRKFRVFYKMARAGERVEIGPSAQSAETMHFVVTESPLARVEDPLESSLVASMDILGNHFESLGLQVFESGMGSGNSSRSWKRAFSTWGEALAGASHVHVAVPQRSAFLWALALDKPVTTSWETAISNKKTKRDPYAGLSPSGLTNDKEAEEWVEKWSPRSSFSSTLDPIAIALRVGEESFLSSTSTAFRDRARREISFDGGKTLAEKIANAAKISAERSAR